MRLSLFILRNLILQTRKRSYPVGLEVWFLVEHFVYVHTSCVRTAKAPVRLRGCAGSLEPPLVAYMISTIISWAGLNFLSSCRTAFFFATFTMFPGHLNQNRHFHRPFQKSSGFSEKSLISRKLWRMQFPQHITWQRSLYLNSSLFHPVAGPLATPKGAGKYV